MGQYSQLVSLDASVYNGTAGTATANYAAAQTNAQLVAAPGAGVSIYLTDLIISNGATAG